MLGGGTFVTQNKRLPGTYHNFISIRRSFLNLSERGFVALPYALSWGGNEVMTITSEEFQRNTMALTGYPYDSEKLKPIREVLRKSHTIYLFPLKGSTAATATNTFADAKYSGVRGNDITIAIRTNVDDTTKFDVQTLVDGQVVEEQIAVSTAADLVANDFVVFKPDATLTATAGSALTGGTDGTIDLTTYQAALDEFEQFAFNVLILDSEVANIKALYVAYTNRMRNETGVKFQLVGQDLGTPDSEGVINVFNATTEGATKLVYWVGGASAGVAVNASNQNTTYDGEYTVDFTGAKTQSQLTTLLDQGRYVLTKFGNEARVLADINSFTSFTSEKSEDFQLNQVIRVLDQIAIDTANIFNTRYLGKVPNDQDGRISLWGDLAAHRNELNRLRAIENYDTSELVVGPGVQKGGVVASEVVNVTVAMSHLYVTTVVA